MIIHEGERRRGSPVSRAEISGDELHARTEEEEEEEEEEGAGWTWVEQRTPAENIRT